MASVEAQGVFIEPDLDWLITIVIKFKYLNKLPFFNIILLSIL
jgi:hypothetical protein